jgi:hypothetical protein
MSPTEVSPSDFGRPGARAASVTFFGDLNEVKGNRRSVIFQLLAEGMREANEAVHRHSHAENLARHIRGVDVLRIGITLDDVAFAGRAFRRSDWAMASRLTARQSPAPRPGGLPS